MPSFTREEFTEMIDRYDESILSLDAGIGTLVRRLRTAGVIDRTVLIITSDHGEAFGEHGMVFHGHSMYRDQVHVPLLIRFPAALPSALRVAAPVGVERVAATMLHLAGLPREVFPGEPLPVSLVDTAQPPVVGGTGRRSLGEANWPTARGWVTSVVADSFHFILTEDGTRHIFHLSDHREERDLERSTDLTDSLTLWTSRYQDRWSTAPAPRGVRRD
jgi:arylsulfatase A-like enzyme